MANHHRTSVERPKPQRPRAARRRGLDQANAVTRATRVNPVAEVPATPVSQQYLRPARSIIGWLPPQIAHQLLAGPGKEPPFDPQIAVRTAAAHAAVAGRPPHQQAAGVVADLPNDTLAAYVNELMAQPFYQASFVPEGGWQVRMADLRRVRALQPHVHTDHAAKRTEGATADDMLSLARITLPHSREKDPIGVVPTPDGRGWVLTCRNPQLHVRGAYKGDVDNDGYKTKVFGIETEIANSLMQVVRWRGAYILRDGYHRAYGLLSRGISSVPVMYREWPDQQPLLPAPNALLFDPAGERAPLLTDYRDDAVAANIEVPQLQRTLLIQVQVMELNTPVL